MRVAILVLVVVTIVLALGLYRAELRIERQSMRISKVKAELATENSREADFRYQRECADQSDRFFTEAGYREVNTAAYRNHYDRQLNRCFIEIETWQPNADIITLSDAYGGSSYGTYEWYPNIHKKYWQVPPKVCKVTLANGKHRTCNSREEFEALIRAYMGDQ